MVALAAMALVTTIGLRSLSGMIAFLERRYDHHTERSVLTGLESRMRRVWNLRLSHSFQENTPWLVFEGRPSGEGLILDSMRLRFVDEDGLSGIWQLTREADHWREAFLEGDGLTRSHDLLVALRGEILVMVEGRAWNPGSIPDRIDFRFPDAFGGQGLTGYSLHRRW